VVIAAVAELKVVDAAAEELEVAAALEALVVSVLEDPDVLVVVAAALLTVEPLAVDVPAAVEPRTPVAGPEALVIPKGGEKLY